MPGFLDYEILRLIWWALLGVLLIGLAIMDGFDFGVASLLPFVAKTDMERRIVINTVGPVWEGNQVWVILGGGAIFAAWPAIYAVTFSGFYLAMFVILAAIILRPVGFKFRSKMEHPLWRQVWDICLFIGGFIPALFFGVAVGNIIQGVPFHFDETLRVTYTGTLFELLNPFALVCGVLSLLMFMRHGAIYLTLKTEDPVARRCEWFSKISTILLLILLGIAWLFVVGYVPGYTISSTIDPLGPSNPLLKTVSTHTGSWVLNFQKYPWMWSAAVLAFLGIILSQITMHFKKWGISFILNSLSIFGIVALPGLMMFPFLLPSSSEPGHSLTVFDASSSKLTLFIMLIAALIFVPLILAYTSWVYHVLRGKITLKTIQEDKGVMY